MFSCLAVPGKARQFNGDLFAHHTSDTSQTAGFASNGGSSLVVSVYSEKGETPLGRQALVRVLNQGTQQVGWQTTTDEGKVTFGELAYGKYDIQVSAVGYLTEHKELQIVNLYSGEKLSVVLQKDPAAVSLDVGEAVLPPKARKNTKRAISALKSGNLKQAQRELDSAYKVAPANPDLNFLLGYLSYQQRDLGKARDFLNAAANLNPSHVQALTLLGRVGLQQDDYELATAKLEKAVASDSENWVAHDLLAGAYLKQQKYEAARQQADLAIAKGKEAAASSRLVLGQALVNMGNQQQGLQVLHNFVDSSPKNPAVPQVRDLIARIESGPTSGAGEQPSKIVGIDPLAAAPEPVLSVQPWQPAGIDEIKPSVASNVTCPTADIVQGAGGRATELVTDVSRIAAIEHLLHEGLDAIGNPTTRQTRDFNYVASVTDQGGRIGVEEYRAEHLGLADFPDQISSSGFAALAFVFHPSLRDDFEMTCEGLGRWQDQATWLIHFRQRDNRPARIHDYRVGGDLYSLRLKGRAWVAAGSYHIVRIESEMVEALPQIQLRSEHQIVEYGPIPFANKKVELWLPKSAEIYFDFRKHRYYRRHSFDHYMLFSAESQEKRNEPKAPPAQEVHEPHK